MTSKERVSKREPLARVLRRRLSDAQEIFFPPIRVVGRFWCYLMHTRVRSDRRGPLFEYVKNGRPCVIAYWHQDSIPLLFELIRYTRGYPCSAMLSRGRFGKFCANLLEPWKFRFALGSNSTGGQDALAELTRDGRNDNRSIFCTMDGSRGPARRARWGAIHIARDSGLPIMLARAWGTNLTVFEKTWMKLGFPWPRGEAIFLSEGPFEVPAEATEDELEAIRSDLEERLDRMAEASMAWTTGEKGVADAWGPPVLGMRAAEERGRGRERSPDRLPLPTTKPETPRSSG